MLDTIRRHQQSWMTYLIFLAIIVVFAVNFGPGSSSGCRGATGGASAAVVDGDTIRQQDFALVYSRRLEAMRRRAQASNFEFTAEMADKMGLRTEVINQLIDAKLLAHEADRRGLKISDAELLEYLQNTYRVKDVNPEDYRNFVERNFRTNVTRFEDEVRDELLGQKMARMVSDNVMVGDAELKKSYLREHDRAMIEYVRFDVASDGPEPTAAAIDQLLANEGKAVEERYTAESYKYRTPEQRQARAIMKKLLAGATDAQVAKARSALQELKGQIDGGADFAALAKQHSEDEASSAKGGDLGEVKRGMLPKSVEDAVFKLKAEELTAEPVRTPLGLYLVQVTSVTPPAQRPQKEVEREVAANILRERAGDAKAKTEATALLSQLRAGKALTSLTETDKEAKDAKEAAEAAKGGKAAKTAKGKPTPVKLTRIESPWILQADEAIAGIGLSPALHQEIFALNRDAPVAKEIHKVGRAYYVVVLKDRETPDLAKFESDKETLREQALWNKRRQVYEDWLKQLRGQAKVELNPSVFGQGRPAPESEG